MLVNLGNIASDKPSSSSILFKGGQCFPLTPEPTNIDTFDQRNDQLNLIINALGGTDRYDTGFIQSKGIHKHLQELNAAISANNLPFLRDLDLKDPLLELL